MTLKSTTGSMECWKCGAMHYVTKSAPAVGHWRRSPPKIDYIEWGFVCCAPGCGAYLVVWQTDESDQAPNVWRDNGNTATVARVARD